MWQRFTERARRVVFFAQEEAARLGEPYVGTEHLLLGLIREEDSVAARILALRLSIALSTIRTEIERQVKVGSGNLGQDMQLTPRAKRVIDLAYEETRHLDNNYIGTEHLLLGLIREGDGLAAQVLVKLGADLERTRAVVAAMQHGDAQGRAAEASVVQVAREQRLRLVGLRGDVGAAEMRLLSLLDLRDPHRLAEAIETYLEPKPEARERLKGSASPAELLAKLIELLQRECEQL